jgi:tripartite-type tricarboxylate transporter receptor subunit TctC
MLLFARCAAAIFLVLMAGIASGQSSAAAQNWPAKPVRLVVPFSPGGSADTLGRLVAQKLSDSLKQNFVVENHAGAGGIIGSELVAKAAPDGYTLLVSGVASHCIAPALSRSLPFDPVRGFTHIALFGGPPGVLVVHPSLAARDLKEFIALARVQRDRLVYASPGNGTQGHLIAEHLKQITGIEMAHLPYKGASPAVADLIAGHVSVASVTLATASAQIHAGKARALAVSSAARVPDFPDVPTFSELGYPDLVASIWFSLSGPPGIPQDIVNRLNAEVRRILQLPEVRTRLRAEGIAPNDLDANQFGQFVAAELKRWAPVVQASGASIN